MTNQFCVFFCTRVCVVFSPSLIGFQKILEIKQRINFKWPKGKKRQIASLDEAAISTRAQLFSFKHVNLFQNWYDNTLSIFKVLHHRSPRVAENHCSHDLRASPK